MNWCMGILLMTAAYSVRSTNGSYNNRRSRGKQSHYCLLGNDRICGTNGFENFLFDNQCEFNDFNRRQLQAGQLALEQICLDNCYRPSPDANYNPSSYSSYCPQYCNLIFRPVCGSFMNVQRNFTNECVLRKYICESKENWQVVQNGTCVSASCALNGQEVCASFENRRQSFPNLLSLYDDIRTTGKNWQILNAGPCPCFPDYKPICAQLNCTARTFQNECFLQQEIRNGRPWSILFFGECPILPSNTNETVTTTTLAPSNTTATTNNSTQSTTPATINSTTAAPPGSASGSLGNSITIPNCNLPSFFNNSNTAINRRPVYIVQHNQIMPYGPQNSRVSSAYEKIIDDSSNTEIASRESGCAGDREQYTSGYSRSERYPNKINKNSHNNDGYSRSRSYTNNNSNSNSYKNRGYNRQSTSYKKSSYKAEYSVKYTPIRVKSADYDAPRIDYGRDNTNDRSEEEESDSMYESLT